MASNTTKTRFELAVELVKAIVWPVIALVILFSFWHPFQLAMEQLPDVVSHSDTITIAGLTLKIDRSLQLQGLEPSAEVRQVLSVLTPDGIRTLLAMGEGKYYPSSPTGTTENDELLRLGLFEEIPPEELSLGGHNYEYGVRPTQLGQDTQNYLLALISEFALQLDQVAPTPTP
jgi:hypothetical protein